MINFSELVLKPMQGRRERTVVASEASADDRGSPERQQFPVEQAQIVSESRLVCVTEPRSPGADRFRFLRMRLLEVKGIANLRSMVITSPLPQDGKSTVVLNLATALADKGKRSVLVIDADLYHPSLAQRLGIPLRPGLGECLEDGLDPVGALRRVEPLGWNLLQAGRAQGNITELIQSDSLVRVFERLTPRFDWVLVDAPPVAPLTDAVSLSRHLDASLLVVRADRTPREAIDQALTLLGPKHVLGIVFNGAKGLNQTYSAYYGYYGEK